VQPKLLSEPCLHSCHTSTISAILILSSSAYLPPAGCCFLVGGMYHHMQNFNGSSSKACL
jgi:Ca2+/H+ antiporter